MRMRVCVATMLTVWLWACATGASGETPAQVSSPTPDELGARIESLIQDLSSDAWTTREKARAELIKIGPPALQRLREVSRNAKDPDLALQADLAVTQIQFTGDFGATLVTLNLEDVTPDVIFTELARQVNVPITFANGVLVASPKTSFKAENEPFWQAFHRACLQWNVRPETAGWGEGLRMVEEDIRDWGRRPFAIHGPFLIQLERLDSTTRIEAANPGARQGILVLSFQILAEPKLDVPWQSLRVATDELIDDKGVSWNGALSAFPTGSNSGRRLSWLARTRLNRPNDSGTRIVRWKGASTVQVTTSYDTIDIADLSSRIGLANDYHGGVWGIEELTPDGANMKLSMMFSRGALDDEAWNRLVRPQHRIALYDDRGQEWRYLDYNEAPEFFDDRQSARITMQFGAPRDAHGQPLGPQPGRPTRLVWRIPKTTTALPLEFSFEDLPIP